MHSVTLRTTRRAVMGVPRIPAKRDGRCSLAPQSASPCRLCPSGVGPSALPARRAGTWLAWPRRHPGPRRSTSPWRLSSPPGNGDSHFVLGGTSGGRRSDSRLRREIARQRPQLRTPFPSASHLGDRVLRPPHRAARFFRVAEHARRARPAAAGPRATPVPASSPWSRPLHSRPGAPFLAAPAAGRRLAALFRWTLHWPERPYGQPDRGRVCPAGWTPACVRCRSHRVDAAGAACDPSGLR